ncbi:MAG: hypothetical protein WAO01_00735, partial [Bradyrhizobium sp.]
RDFSHGSSIRSLACAKPGVAPPQAPHETIFPDRRNKPEIKMRSNGPGQKRGSVMWDVINFFYRRSCRRFLLNVVLHGHRWI